MPQRPIAEWPRFRRTGTLSDMDNLALTIMASALTFSGFVVLVGWR